MGSAVGADPVADGAAGPGAGGVVSRPRLFGRLAAQARVSVMSAPAGSGKTVLLRSWISWAGVADRVAWVAAGRDRGGVGAGAGADGGAGPGWVGDHRAAAGGSGPVGGPGVAGGRRRARAGPRRAGAAGAADPARPAGAAVRAGHPA